MHYACISRIMMCAARYELCVNVITDHVGMPTILLLKHYIFNILSSDYSSILKLYWKFEESCKMLWYNFHKD